MSNKIFVKDLDVEAVIGIFNWEREVKQLIRISYEVEVEISKAFDSDKIEDTFDYKKTSKRIINYVEKSSFQLIEALAEQVVKIIFRDKYPYMIGVNLNFYLEFYHINSEFATFQPGTAG